jgi:hypothetical protein
VGAGTRKRRPTRSALAVHSRDPDPWSPPAVAAPTVEPNKQLGKNSVSTGRRIALVSDAAQGDPVVPRVLKRARVICPRDQNHDRELPTEPRRDDQDHADAGAVGCGTGERHGEHPGPAIPGGAGRRGDQGHRRGGERGDRHLSRPATAEGELVLDV